MMNIFLIVNCVLTYILFATIICKHYENEKDISKEISKSEFVIDKYYVKGWTTVRIAAALGVKTSKVRNLIQAYKELES